jgi:hypothetical protein
MGKVQIYVMLMRMVHSYVYKGLMHTTVTKFHGNYSSNIIGGYNITFASVPYHSHNLMIVLEITNTVKLGFNVIKGT